MNRRPARLSARIDGYCRFSTRYVAERRPAMDSRIDALLAALDRAGETGPDDVVSSLQRLHDRVMKVRER
jgi:hypothetical protein